MKQLITALVLLAAAGSVPTLHASEPRAVVEQLHEQLLGIMREADQLGFSGRADRIRATVENSFDFPTIARIVTGRAWKAASEEQKSTFIDVFRRLSTATYASNFAGYGGEKFVTDSSEETRSAMVVRTFLVKPDGEKISLNYMLRENNGNWQIVNVIAQGVSDLSLKRAEYTAVIKSEGFDSLVDRLRQKVDDLNRG